MHKLIGNILLLVFGILGFLEVKATHIEELYQENFIVRGAPRLSIYPVIGSSGSIEYYYEPRDHREVAQEFLPRAQGSLSERFCSNNPGVRFYSSEEKKIEVQGNDKEIDFCKYNHLVIRSLESLNILKEKDLFTIRTIDFHIKDEKKYNKHLIEFFKTNNSLISLSKIDLSHLSVNLEVLSSLKKVQFDEEAVVRKSEFLDKQVKSAVAPIYVSVEEGFLKALKTSDSDKLKEVLRPCEKYIPTIYMENPFEERLSRLKVYLNE